MVEPFKKIAKYIAREQEDEKQAEEFRAAGGFVDTDNHPYDRLRKRLRKAFPGYPPIFDYNQSEEDDE